MLIIAVKTKKPLGAQIKINDLFKEDINNLFNSFSK